MHRTLEREAILDRASLILLSVGEGHRGALMESMAGAYLEGMKRKWPDLAEGDLLCSAANMVRDVFRRLDEIEAAGGRISGRA